MTFGSLVFTSASMSALPKRQSFITGLVMAIERPRRDLTSGGFGSVPPAGGAEGGAGGSAGAAIGWPTGPPAHARRSQSPSPVTASGPAARHTPDRVVPRPVRLMASLHPPRRAVP